MSSWDDLVAALRHRFGDVPEAFEDLESRSEGDEPPALWQALAGRGSVRAFREPAPSIEDLRLIAALALGAPTKSDLQQRDLVLVDDRDQIAALKTIFADQAWTAGAPALVVVCGNNRRQRLLHDRRGHPFVNDHLDAFFNASVDAGIVLAAFVLAAEAAGFGTCPISAIRNDAVRASAILGLPDHVFPIAALAVGHPSAASGVSLRLPLTATVHDNRYNEHNIDAEIDGYDRRRADAQPYASQRRVADLGQAEFYPWSEDKARQYSVPERADFGAFVRAKGFRLD